MIRLELKPVRCSYSTLDFTIKQDDHCKNKMILALRFIACDDALLAALKVGDGPTSQNKLLRSFVTILLAFL